MPKTTAKQEKQQDLLIFLEELRDEAEKERGRAANEIVGQVGLGAAGVPKSLGTVEGSPLFGSSQRELFPPAFPQKKIDSDLTEPATPYWWMAEKEW